MKERNDIAVELLKAEKKARSGKFSRFIRAPLLYPSLMIFNHVIYPLLLRGIYYRANTFFGIPMRTKLPSGTDIVLNGIKSHDSEIRLTKYLARTLNEGNVFVDIGAHLGYYSLLASVLVKDNGKVFSIEASLSSFNDLTENTGPYKNIQVFHAAAGDLPGMITFYEYPGPYAEYNTTIPNAYVDQDWFRNVKQIINTVPVLILDDFFKNEGINEAIIKIDVEGGESSVLRGLVTSLEEKKLTIAMEYLLPEEASRLHYEAAAILYKAGYDSYAITPDGGLMAISTIDEYLEAHQLNSDNIIFKKR